MSSEIHVPSYMRYDTTLPIVVPRDFSREKAIKALRCDRPYSLDEFPEVELPPGLRKVHLIHPSESKSLGEILQAIDSERTMEPEPPEIALVLAAQHLGYEIETGIAFLGSLWSVGENINTIYFLCLSNSMNCRPVLRLRSNQWKLHPGWQIAVSSPPGLAFDPRSEAEQMEAATTGWIQSRNGELAA